MESHLAHILAWLEPHALLLALGLPPLIRAVGHVIPEELFMVAVGVLAARAGSPTEAVVLLAAAGLSHLITDQAVYLAGRWLRPRLDRFPRISSQLESVTARLNESPAAMVGFVPARVLPLGRGAWIAGCGVAGISWRRFLTWDLVALSVHLLAWSGLGWWLAGDLARLEATTATGKVLGTWVAVALVTVVSTIYLAKLWPRWQPATVRVARRLGRSFRQGGSRSS